MVTTKVSDVAAKQSKWHLPVGLCRSDTEMFVLLMDWPDNVTKSVSLLSSLNPCDHRFHTPPGPLPLTKVSSISTSSMGGSGRIFCENHCPCTQYKPLRRRVLLRSPRVEKPTLHAHAIGDETNLQAGRGCLYASSHSASDASRPTGHTFLVAPQET